MEGACVQNLYTREVLNDIKLNFLPDRIQDV